MKDLKFFAGIVIGLGMSLIFLSIGLMAGPAYAPPMIGTNDIVDDAIISQKIKDGEVKTQDLANGTVTKDKISPFALKLVTVSRYANFTATHPFHFLHGEVKCNTGETATGGGYYNAEPHMGTVTFMSRPIQDNSGWHVGIFSPVAVHQFTAYVVCAHLELSP